jgi:hypothetical protein
MEMGRGLGSRLARCETLVSEKKHMAFSWKISRKLMKMVI